MNDPKLMECSTVRQRTASSSQWHHGGRYSLLVALVLAGAGPASGQTTAELALYEKRCGQCHGADAESLARTTLRKVGGKIVTRERAIELTKFLSRHGRSTPDEVQRLYGLLRRYLEVGSD